MAFDIYFQRITLPNNYVDKKPTNIITLSGTLRDAATVENPSIMIETSDTNIFTCNYMTIPTFSRSYFIDKHTSYRNNFVIISAHVDVLYTYRTQILASSAIIARQENDFSFLLDDGQYKSFQNPFLDTKVFPNMLNQDNYILIMAGSAGS